MPEKIDAFLQALPAAATSPSSFVGYALVVASAFLISYRTKRHAQLLRHLKELPSHQRLQALKDEMGTIDVPRGLSPEQWLRSRIHRYIFIGLAIGCTSILIVAVAAITGTPPDGRVEVEMDLYQPPSKLSAGTPSATAHP